MRLTLVVTTTIAFIVRAAAVWATWVIAVHSGAQARTSALRRPFITLTMVLMITRGRLAILIAIVVVGAAARGDVLSTSAASMVLLPARSVSLAVLLVAMLIRVVERPGRRVFHLMVLTMVAERG